jgi:hypothetical protein
MVMDPYSFWERQKDAANVTNPGYSYNSLAGKMILTVTDADKCRELMAVNDPERMLMVLHPSAKTILGANNLAFLHGPEHKAIRKSFLSLFTRKALSTYIQLQDGIIRGHLQRWLHTPDTREIRDAVRDMNQATSQDVFVGPYLDGPGVRQNFSRAYYAMTDGFLVRSARSGQERSRGVLAPGRLHGVGPSLPRRCLAPKPHPTPLPCTGLPRLPTRHGGVACAQGPHLHLQGAEAGGRARSRAHQGAGCGPLRVMLLEQPTKGWQPRVCAACEAGASGTACSQPRPPCLLTAVWCRAAPVRSRARSRPASWTSGPSGAWRKSQRRRRRGSRRPATRPSRAWRTP